jgi:proton glutamate symport protein
MNSIVMGRLPLYARILLGMLLGVIAGFIAISTGFEHAIVDWVKPWGIIFLNLLKLIAVPLVFASIITGIASLSSISRFSRMGVLTLGLYLVTTVMAISTGLVMVNLIQPGKSFTQDARSQYQNVFDASVQEKAEAADNIASQSPLQFLVDMVPENFIMAASNNAKMLQVIFFAVLLALAILSLPKEKTTIVRQFLGQVNDIMIRVIDLVMIGAPVGVFALMASLVTDFSGDARVFSALGWYAITVIAGLLLIVILIYPLSIKLFTRLKYIDFIRAMLPAQILAFTTSSSAATLPVTMEQCQKELKLPEEVVGFVLPVGVTVNMDGTSCYQAIAAVFIAQVFGMELNFMQQLMIILTATLSSIGSPGVPGGSIVMLVIVLTSVGIPVEGLALILGIDRPLDMLRTVVNVTGDSAVACIVSTKVTTVD